MRHEINQQSPIKSSCQPSMCLQWELTVFKNTTTSALCPNTRTNMKLKIYCVWRHAQWEWSSAENSQASAGNIFQLNPAAFRTGSGQRSTLAGSSDHHWGRMLAGIHWPFCGLWSNTDIFRKVVHVCKHLQKSSMNYSHSTAHRETIITQHIKYISLNMLATVCLISFLISFTHTHAVSLL